MDNQKKVIQGECIDYDWLNRSVVASWTSCRGFSFHLDSLRTELGYRVRLSKLGNCKILITLQDVNDMKEALARGLVWLCCPSVPLHAWCMHEYLHGDRVKLGRVEDRLFECRVSEEFFANEADRQGGIDQVNSLVTNGEDE
ncbi:hypothetical protein Dimus_011051 [Dionaea muscipula]